jgi:hypothetical protein
MGEVEDESKQQEQQHLLDHDFRVILQTNEIVVYHILQSNR